MTLEIALRPRAGVGELIEQYLNGEIKEYDGTPDSLYAKVRSLGYSCNSLYEMVCSAEAAQSHSSSPSHSEDGNS
jgi:hypothetical protein